MVSLIAPVSDSLAGEKESPRLATVYYLAWRLRPHGVWRSAEFLHRFEAHGEYLKLLERGAEVYLETRRRALPIR